MWLATLLGGMSIKASRLPMSNGSGQRRAEDQSIPKSLRTRMAALWPAAPITEPAG
jgi:hypothetical protein